jgi:hypothetical protein
VAATTEQQPQLAEETAKSPLIFFDFTTYSKTKTGRGLVLKQARENLSCSVNKTDLKIKESSPRMKTYKYPPMSKVESSQNSTCRNGLPSLSIALTASLAILALSATPMNAQTPTNWLANPGFELGTNGWINMPTWNWNGPSWAVENTNLFVNGSTTVKVSVHSGTNAFKIWGYFQPYTTTPAAMQTFRAAPGSQWTASGWASTQTPNQMTSTETSYLEVQFLDSTMNYGSPLADYVSSTMTASSTPSTWLPFQVVDNSSSTTLTAPPGTAFVRFQMRFTQPTGYPAGSCYWDDVQLIRTSKPDPEITVQPAPVTLVYGQTATFSVTADGLTTLAYKWQKDSADITGPNAYGVNTATLTLSNISSAMQGGYTCTVTDQAGPLTSDSAQLTVNDPGVLYITPALGQTITNGGTASIKVSAAGSAALTYSWYLNNNQLSDNGRISGTTTSNLTVANLTAADAGTYLVNVNGGAAQATTGLKVVPRAQLATNLLANPGFEDGVWSEPWETAWTKFNGAVLDTADSFYDVLNQQGPVNVLDGTYVGEVYSTDPDDGFYQGVPVTPGATYHAGGMAYMSHYGPVAGTTTVTLELMFKDAGGNTILLCQAPRFATNGLMTTDAWLSMQITNGAGTTDLVAPAGAVSATCQVYEFNWDYFGGAVYFDDLYLTQAALPPPAAVTVTPSAVSGVMHLAFPTASGVTYEVLYANSLSSPITWHTNTTIAGDGTQKTATDRIGATQRFYRVMAHH